jgi:hypothetical protein
MLGEMVAVRSQTAPRVKIAPHKRERYRSIGYFPRTIPHGDFPTGIFLTT